MVVTVMRRRVRTPSFSHGRTNVCQSNNRGEPVPLRKLCQTTQAVHRLWTTGINFSPGRIAKGLPTMGNTPYLVIFSGCVQPTQKGEKTSCQVPVTAPTRHKTEVVEQNDDGAKAKQNEHQHRHPWCAVLYILRHGRGVAAVRIHGWFLMTNVQTRLIATLRGYASARFLLCCHEASVEPRAPSAIPHQLVSRKGPPHGRLKEWHGFW